MHQHSKTLPWEKLYFKTRGSLKHAMLGNTQLSKSENIPRPAFYFWRLLPCCNISISEKTWTLKLLGSWPQTSLLPWSSSLLRPFWQSYQWTWGAFSLSLNHEVSERIENQRMPIHTWKEVLRLYHHDELSSYGAWWKDNHSLGKTIHSSVALMKTDEG